MHHATAAAFGRLSSLLEDVAAGMAALPTIPTLAHPATGEPVGLDAVNVLDPDLTVRRVSACDAARMGGDLEYVGGNVYDFTHDEDVPSLMEAHHRLLTEPGVTVECLLRAWDARGRCWLLWWVAAGVRNAQGVLESVLVACPPAVRDPLPPRASLRRPATLAVDAFA